MFKDLFKPPVDYTTEMDFLQFAREAKKKATAHLPQDSSTWTDEHWAIDDEWEAKVPPLGNPECVCKGIVIENDVNFDHIRTRLKLDPPPRHRALPKEVTIIAYRSVHSLTDFAKLHDLAVGDPVDALEIVLCKPFQGTVSYPDHRPMAGVLSERPRQHLPANAILQSHIEDFEVGVVYSVRDFTVHVLPRRVLAFLC